jgi:hypothetical protein
VEWNFLFDIHLKIKSGRRKREEVKKGQKECSLEYALFSKVVD